MPTATCLPLSQRESSRLQQSWERDQRERGGSKLATWRWTKRKARGVHRVEVSYSLEWSQQLRLAYSSGAGVQNILVGYTISELCRRPLTSAKQLVPDVTRRKRKIGAIPIMRWPCRSRMTRQCWAISTTRNLRMTQ